MARIAIRPGEHFAEELSELEMSAAELARQLGVPTNRITEILNGQRAITGDTALHLAHFLARVRELWLNLQSLYEIRLAERRSGKSFRALPTLKHSEQVNAQVPPHLHRQTTPHACIDLQSSQVLSGIFFHPDTPDAESNNSRGNIT